ncbi:MAG: dockerin type I repeat-containing protein [Candidatus Zixiibacteriota bacterium]
MLTKIIHYSIAPLIILIALFSISIAKTPGLNTEISRNNSQFDTNESPCLDIKTSDTNNIQLLIDNYGEIGNFPEPIIGWEPFNIYPKESGNGFLFGAGYWIGAVVGEDTLVSVGIDGWGIVREMYPDVCPDGEIEFSNDISHQDYTAVFYDTLTDSFYVKPDDFNNRPHIPLNLKITQQTYAWDYPLAEDFIIFKLTIENIGPIVLNDLFMGIFVDGDVVKTTGYGFTDDIAGFKSDIESPYACGNDTINLAYIADNDGRENELENDCSLTAVTGIRLLSSPSDSLFTNFNWWVSNGNPLLDWGPRQAGTPDDPFRDFGGFLGTPEGDRNKYYIMSHPEVDYDQIFTASDLSSYGWLPPPPMATDISDGIDAKYLLSFGPFDVEMGQSLPIVFAYVGGENFHASNCQDFEDLFDWDNPQPFYDQLNFRDIGENSIMAQWVYDNPGVDTDGDGYYGAFRICGNDTVYYRGDGIPDMNPLFVCGDINADGRLNLLDITNLIGYLFAYRPEPPGLVNADIDNNGKFNIMDIIYLISYLYKGGEKPNCMLIMP